MHRDGVNMIMEANLTCTSHKPMAEKMRGKPATPVTYLPQLAALLGKLHCLRGAVNQLDGNGHHGFQLFWVVPHQQHLRIRCPQAGHA